MKTNKDIIIEERKKDYNGAIDLMQNCMNMARLDEQTKNDEKKRMYKLMLAEAIALLVLDGQYKSVASARGIIFKTVKSRIK
jgi:hypothetical protein